MDYEEEEEEDKKKSFTVKLKQNKNRYANMLLRGQ